LIFVGRHDRQKGLDYLLDVFCGADLPGIHLHIVGAPVLGRSGGIRQTKYPSNITFYGWKSRNAVSSMIAAADALIMPSRWEGFGLVALEAMRVGKPVLASRRGALAEIVEHGRTGMHFDLDHPSELRDILFGLRKKNLAEMGKAARSKFLHSFTSDRLNGELIALYRNLLERKAGEQAFPWAVRRNRLQWVWPNK
jgi:glycosyltransferase involved in cell wall biosynthesis